MLEQDRIDHPALTTFMERCFTLAASDADAEREVALAVIVHIMNRRWPRGSSVSGQSPEGAVLEMVMEAAVLLDDFLASGTSGLRVRLRIARQQNMRPRLRGLSVTRGARRKMVPAELAPGILDVGAETVGLSHPGGPRGLIFTMLAAIEGALPEDDHAACPTCGAAPLDR